MLTGTTKQTDAEFIERLLANEFGRSTPLALATPAPDNRRRDFYHDAIMAQQEAAGIYD